MPTPNPAAVTSVSPTPDEPKLRLGDVHYVVREHPAFTESSIRSLVHRAAHNGLNRHVYKLGRRVLIDLNGFEEWVRGKQVGRAI